MSLLSVIAASRRRGGVFNPLSIPGCQLWLKADALSLADGDPVETWADSSTNANNAAQATGSKQPVWKAAILGGRPVVRFDGVDDALLVRSLASAQPYTVFAVASFVAGGNPDHQRVFDGAGGARCLLGPQSGILIIYAGALLSSTVSTPCAAAVWRCLFNGVSSSLHQNGGAGWSGAAGSGDFTSGVTVGTSSGETGENLTGDIAEILIYNSALSDAQAQAVEDYLGTKYAISITH